ncbi:MAG: metallophosphatase [Bacteroidota bacterium]
MKRRKFVQTLTATSILSSIGHFPLRAYSEDDLVQLTVLHTNDVHSRIEPFPMDGSRNQGLGGAARRTTLIKKIRSEVKHTLLLDAGDIFQGTPYFNFFLGELEFKLMSAMKYDAATIGNHDFDAGIDGLNQQLPQANFPLLNANYNFSNTVLNGKIKPYQIFKRGGLKIGVFGLGIELQGLVATEMYKDTRYLDPLDKGNQIAQILKQDEKCDLVICLSHLGYRYRGKKVSDVVLAENSRYIDLIIGGHTHTFMKKAESYQNLDQEEVIVNQVGWAGMMLGRLDFYFERNKKGKCVSCTNQLLM